MDWVSIGNRIRKQREFLGYTREALAEKVDITTKFCSDIELGIKGMSVPTLCRFAHVLSLSTDYILFGATNAECESPAIHMIRSCPADKRVFLEDIVKAYMQALDADHNCLARCSHCR